MKIKRLRETHKKRILSKLFYQSTSLPQGLLKSCNSLNAAYLYQKDKHYDVTFDTGDLSIQCGRHNDIFKLWLMWRSKVGKGAILR